MEEEEEEAEGAAVGGLVGAGSEDNVGKVCGHGPMLTWHAGTLLEELRTSPAAGTAAFKHFILHQHLSPTADAMHMRCQRLQRRASSRGRGSAAVRRARAAAAAAMTRGLMQTLPLPGLVRGAVDAAGSAYVDAAGRWCAVPGSPMPARPVLGTCVGVSEQQG